MGSLIVTLWALIAVGLRGGFNQIRPRLWALLTVAGFAAVALVLA